MPYPHFYNASCYSKRDGVTIIRLIDDVLVHDKVQPKIYVKDVVYGQLIELNPHEALYFVEELLHTSSHGNTPICAILYAFTDKLLDNKLPRRRYPLLYDLDIQDINAEEDD